MKPQIGVIGLGKFGRSCAIRLAELGFEVLAIDETQANVDSIKDDVALAVVADTTDPAELEAAGIKNCDTVVLTIGAEIERSVLTAAGPQGDGHTPPGGKGIVRTARQAAFSHRCRSGRLS